MNDKFGAFLAIAVLAVGLAFLILLFITIGIGPA